MELNKQAQTVLSSPISESHETVLFLEICENKL